MLTEEMIKAFFTSLIQTEGYWASSATLLKKQYLKYLNALAGNISLPQPKDLLFYLKVFLEKSDLTLPFIKDVFQDINEGGKGHLALLQNPEIPILTESLETLEEVLRISLPMFPKDLRTGRSMNENWSIQTNKPLESSPPVLDDKNDTDDDIYECLYTPSQPENSIEIAKNSLATQQEIQKSTSQETKAEDLPSKMIHAQFSSEQTTDAYVKCLSDIPKVNPNKGSETLPSAPLSSKRSINSHIKEKVDNLFQLKCIFWNSSLGLSIEVPSRTTPDKLKKCAKIMKDLNIDITIKPEDRFAAELEIKNETAEALMQKLNTATENIYPHPAALFLSSEHTDIKNFKSADSHPASIPTPDF